MQSQLDTAETNTSTDIPFAIEEVQLQFQLQSSLCKLLVRNNYVFLILKNGVVYRINLESPELVTTIKLPLGTDAIVTNAWIDVHKYHLIIGSSKNEYFYINHNSTAYLPLPKLKNLIINSICFFDKCTNETYTGPLLLCTSNGALLEYAIDANKEMLLKTIMKTPYCCMNIVNNLIAESDGVLEYVITMGTSENTITRYMTKIPGNPSTNVSVFQNLSKTNPLVRHIDNLVEVSSHKNVLAYTVRSAGAHPSMDLYVNEDRNKNLKVFKPTKIDIGKEIRCFVLTGYYLLILTNQNTLEIFDQISLTLIRTMSLGFLNSKILGLSYDQLAKTYWLFSKAHIYELVIDFENTGITESLIQRNMFDEALSLVGEHSKDDQQYNYILKRKAYYLLNEKKYTQAIDEFVKTDEAFDKISLKLIDLKDRSILRYYLTRKLETTSKNLKAQKCLLSSWIVESYVEELNALDNKLININDQNGKSRLITDGDMSSNPADTSASDNLQSNFYGFLTRNVGFFDKETIYQIIISHNRSDDLLYFANLAKDFHFVLKYYITLQQWDNSLKVLSRKNSPELVYKSATVLLVNYPVKTVDTWIRVIDDLDPIKLIPALLTYLKTVALPQGFDPERNQALRFLKFLIYEKQVQSRLVHNTYFSTLITYPSLPNESVILKNLEEYLMHRKKHHIKDNKDGILFDIDFILRLCFKFEKIETAIYLYSLVGLYLEAVTLALKNELLEAAILVADKPTDIDNKDRKQLWLKISAKLINKVVENPTFIYKYKTVFFTEAEQNELLLDPEMQNTNRQIYILLKFLTNKCTLLSIKDLLPLFPDFIVIDNFKESLVDSLKQLSLEMSSISADVDKTLQESENINAKIKNFEAKNFQAIYPFDSCEICHSILTIRKFIVFPCSHAFHQDCLVKQILNSNDYKTKSAIYKLQKEVTLNSKNSKVMDELRGEIDKLLSKSCCLCSDIKINEIDEPLFQVNDSEQNEWAI